MRITSGMMMRKYGKNLNVNLGRMNKSSAQIESGRRFHKASEDPVRALKALQVRRNLNQLDQYSSNIDTVSSWLDQTEVAVSAIKAHADKAVDLLIQGRNDTMAPEDRRIIATSLRSIQEALLKDLNSMNSNQYLLGGANTKIVPFTTDADGHLMFNGESVYEMGLPESGEKFTSYNPEEHEFESMETKVFVDLTGEFQLTNYDDPIEDALVDKSTVFNMHMTGLNVIGVGPNNLYDLLGRLIYAFESESEPNGIIRMNEVDGPITDDDDVDFDGAYVSGEDGHGLFQRLQDAQLNALISLVNVGEKANFINYLKERNEEYIYQAEVMMNKLESMPPDEAIMNFKMEDYVYKACLQMGSYIFQPSLMDYIK